ncbi:MAG: glycine cleavage system protein GcvH [Planctomycetaceae bacterium]|nr:glycine cleavage system protein GcvH [Planctomycetaceae bacterium]
MNPEDLLFAETHEWAKVIEENGSKVATVGISAFAVEQLTDLVYMELPSVGTPVEAGSEFGEVESVKAVSPLYSPVTGEIIDVNSGLPDSLETLNSDPYNAGWILKVKITDESSLGKLLDYAAYQKQCAEEG